MNEKINKSESEKKTRKKSIAAATALLMSFGGVGVAMGQNEQRQKSADDHFASVEKPLSDEQVNALQEQLSARYPDTQQVGDSFIIKDGEGYLEKSVEQVKKVFGDETARTSYDQLRTAAIYQVIPRPDGTYAVVKVDTNNDGSYEFLPVSTSQIIHESNGKIPTPVIDSVPNNK